MSDKDKEPVADESCASPLEAAEGKVQGQAVPRVPSLDELSNDLDVPNEMPAAVSWQENLMPRMLEEKLGKDDLESIRKLVETRRVESALQQLSPGKHGLEGGLLRLRCLLGLRRWRECLQDCQAPALADSPEAQLLLAQLPYLQDGKAYEAMLKLQALAESWSQQGVEEELHLRLLQVLSQISLAAGHGLVGCRELQKALPGHGGRQLWSLLGRHHLSWGNLAAAKDAFEEARTCEGEESTVFLNEGLMAMAKGDYASARNAFEAASPSLRDEEALAAENNLAVCKFYTKDLGGACERLEALVKKEPRRFLKPCILQNLGSLYEFSQDAAGKRRQLQMLAATSQLEDLDEKLFQAPQM